MVKPIQLILGSNGCGKSSLLRTLQPMPLARQAFDTYGGYTLEVTHEDLPYTLSLSFVEQKPSYSLLKGAEKTELNINHSYTVQKELVEKIFGLNTLRQELLSGSISFTDLRPMERRDLFMEICSIDFSYIESKYNDVHQLYKNRKAVYKHLKEREHAIKDTLSKIRSIKDEDINAMEKQIHELYRYRQHEVDDPKKLDTFIQEQSQAIDTLLTNIKTAYLPTVFTKDVKTIDDIDDVMTQLISQRDRVQHDIDVCQQLVEEAENLTQDDRLDIRDINTILANYKTKLSDPVKYIDTNIDDKHLKNLIKFMNYIRNLYDTIKVEIFTEEESRDIHHRYTEISNLYTKLKTQLDILEQHKHPNVTTCPKCYHKFVVRQDHNISFDEYQKRLDTKIQSIQSQLDKTIIEWKNIQARHKALDLYKTTKEQLSFTIHELQIPYDVVTSIQGPEGILANPTKTLVELEHWYKKFCEQKEYEEEISKYQSYDQYNRLKHKLLSTLTQHFNHQEHVDHDKSIDILLKELYKKHALLCRVINRYELIKKNYTYYSRLIQDIERRVSQYYKLLKRFIDASIAEEAKTYRDDLYAELGSLKKQLYDLKHYTNTLQDLSKEIRIVEEDIEDYKQLEYILSSKTGIIAEHLRGFIEYVLKEVNTIIADIWSYPMEVVFLSAQQPNKPLDYKFGLRLQETFVDDIRKASAGQKEIIDFAFLLLFRKQLNMISYPLYLDETGFNFDEHHRERFINYIQTLYDSGLCDQIFMINHFATMYALSNTLDVVVLDPDNVYIESEYNTHVHIQRNL